MRLASDYDALDVANKVSSTILSSVAVSLSSFVADWHHLNLNFTSATIFVSL